LIIDNKSGIKIYEWLKEYTENGKLDIVTGYFTVGILSYLYNNINDKIQKYRIIVGDIVNDDSQKETSLNLLNENLSIDTTLQLKQKAREAVKLLQQTKLQIKTLEPNFCHAKVYIFDNKDDRYKYFISGSSNLTEAGIGLKYTSNVELNIAETGNNNQYKELKNWFNELWNKKEAHTKKTIINNGKKEKKDFKTYLIEEIKKIFIDYSPKTIYYKILYELFAEDLLKIDNDPEFSKEIGRLENSKIYNSLYPFQQKGVLSLIKMLQKYNGAILADAVGLGKTWSALAVMKYYQLQGYENILLCPKKLANNWQQYLYKRGSKFEGDKFDFVIRFHTDLFENRLERDGLTIQDYFQSDKPKLLIIDESHNLRNAKSNRYKFLVENILQKNDNIKVLLLSATPINNSLNDIKNQFKLIVKGDDYGFSESLDVKSIDGTFREAQRKFNEWIEKENAHISSFIRSLPANFFRLTDSLTVARTRNMIKDDTINLTFPKKHSPKNLYITPSAIGNFKSFSELLESLPPKLTAYKPAMYINIDSDSVLNDEGQRDRALVRMMYILLLKRLESSWESFYKTIQKVYEYHKKIYKLAINYKENKQNITLSNQNIIIDDEEFEDIGIGKREIKLSDIEKSDELDTFINDLQDDITSMAIILKNLQSFATSINKETTEKSQDTKLQKLIELLKDKQTKQNKKVIIFTAYTDTATYLYKELLKRGFINIGMVTGELAKTYDKKENIKNYEEILQRFAPYTKLYLEKEWKDFDGNNYEEWLEYIQTKDILNLVQNQLDILIATDVLSEGQNLQDADMVINYDIHWNPVRVIQRMGRIDRIGSPNDEIFGVNFWPASDINDYLDLQNRIEQRMATMKIVGSEIDHTFTNRLKQISQDEELEQKQLQKMLKQMQVSWDDIETNDDSLGFNDFSLEEFRQDLFSQIQQQKEFFSNLPNGIFSGFKVNENEGLIALLGYPAKSHKNNKYNYYELIYIDEDSKEILSNQKEILNFLKKHKDEERFVSKDIDSANTQSILKLQKQLKNWIKSLSSKEIITKNGVQQQAGKKQIDILNKLKKGSKKAVQEIQTSTIEDKYKDDNFDLIVWEVVTKG